MSATVTSILDRIDELEAEDPGYRLIPADRAMQTLLDAGCPTDLGSGWKLFTFDLCCVEYAIHALRHPSGWIIREMVPMTAA